VQALYAGRLVPPITIVELEEKRRLPPAELKRREAELIVAAASESAKNGAACPSLDGRWRGRRSCSRTDSSAAHATSAASKCRHQYMALVTGQ